MLYVNRFTYLDLVSLNTNSFVQVHFLIYFYFNEMRNFKTLLLHEFEQVALPLFVCDYSLKYRAAAEGRARGR